MEQKTEIQPAALGKTAGEDVEIKSFLEGRNPLERVVAIETSYSKSYAHVIVQNNDTRKKTVKTVSYKPFLFMKDIKKHGLSLYKSKAEQYAAMNKYHISIKPLRVTDDNGSVVDRLENGYKYRVSTTDDRGFQAIQDFFRNGGVDIRQKTKKTASFPLKDTVRRDDILYTLLGEKDGHEFLYNHVSDRLEIHIASRKISKFVDKKGDDDTATYIKVVGDKEELQYKKDFELFELPEYGKTVIVLIPQDMSANQLPDWNPKLDEYIKGEIENKGGEYTEKEFLKWERAHTKHLKDRGEWLPEDALLQRAINKRRKAIVANNGVAPMIKPYDYKKVAFSFTESYSDLFFMLKNEEQFMIDTGIRLFKGLEMYNEVHKFIFDIETTGLNPHKDRCFMIGMKDNRGFQQVLAVNEINNDEEERNLLYSFFWYVKEYQPAIIYGYNSENFDWDFIITRMTKLGIDFTQVPISLRDGIPLKRRENATVKFGGETENYTQTVLWGANVVDIYHAVRRTQAINSDIKEGRLKYICKYENISKPNRVYIEGADIFKMYQENKVYAVHKDTNVYTVVPEALQAFARQVYDDGVSPQLINAEYSNDIIFRLGSTLVEEYLIDDLWETEQVDELYNVDRFMLAKYLPTSFQRTCTMGGASQWNLIMTAWSYEQGVAIPEKIRKRDFTGGLSRTFMLGKFSNVYKFDFSGLYPSEQLEWDIFPKVDVTGVLKRLLKFFKDTRDVFKAMANNEELDEVTRSVAKTKQLPLKIMNNSNFGANGSEFFNWADLNCAERITCTGRLYLRNMIQFFMVYGCVPTVCDTDGINMVVPEIVKVDINGNPLMYPLPITSYEYTTKKGKVITGADALVAKYNEEVLAKGKDFSYMKLDNDGMWPTAINIARKNYANMEAPKKDKVTGEMKSKIKMVGNTLKDKTMAEYIKEFMDKGIKLLLEDKGRDFIEYYYEYLFKIYTHQIPLKKIAKKARVKMSAEDYKNRGVDKNGRQKGKQAHMELVIQDNLRVQNGDIIYYVNIGTRKTHKDTTFDKETQKYMSKALTKDELDLNPDMLGEYNILLYVDQFNKRVESLLVPFKPRVRESLLKIDPQDREHFSEGEMELVYYQNPNPKDDITNFFIMEESEVRFWNRTGLDPYHILKEFETPTEYYGIEYQNRLNEVQVKLIQAGSDIKVKDMHSRYTNGDLVVSFEDKFYAQGTEQQSEIPDKFYKYLNEDAKMKYPLHAEDYSEFRQYVTLFGEDTNIKRKRHYHLNKVEAGKLIKKKELVAA